MTNRVQFVLAVFLLTDLLSVLHIQLYTLEWKRNAGCMCRNLWPFAVLHTHLLNNLLRQTHRTNPPNCVTGTNAIWEVMGLGCRFTCEHFACVVELVGDLLTEQHRRTFVLTCWFAGRSREASLCQVETDKLGWVTTPSVFVLVVGARMNGMSASYDAIIVWIIRRHICRISDVWLCVGTNHAGVMMGCVCRWCFHEIQIQTMCSVSFWV